jgi:hypothetical protein
MTEKNDERQSKSWIRRHPILTTLISGLAGLSIYAAVTAEEYPSVVKGRVVEEKYVPETAGKDDNPHYILHLKINDPLEQNAERLCTLYVKPNVEMPIPVLNEVVSTGSEVYFPFTDDILPIGEPGRKFSLGCFGTVSSEVLRVVRPWESSAQVKKSLEGKLEGLRQAEEDRLLKEVKTKYSSRYIF